MKEKHQAETKRQNNPYKKDFDDASRLLERFGNMEFLNEIIDDEQDRSVSIPFPYGNHSEQPYNFNSN